MKKINENVPIQEMWIRAQLVCILYVTLCVQSNPNEPATSKEKK